jgi:hypothetical protein
MRLKPTPKTFSGRIRRLTEVLRVSITTLSVEAGLSPSGLSGAMRAEGCTMATLAALHERTGVDLNWLVCGDGDMGLVVLQKRPAACDVCERDDGTHAWVGLGSLEDPIVPCPNEPTA